MFTRSVKLRRGLLVLAAACGLGLAGVSPARAQLDIIPKVRLKAGVFFPTDSSLTNSSGSVWFKVAGDIGIPLGAASGRLGIEYAGNGSSHVVPVLIGGSFRPSAVVATSPIYVGAAIGAYNIKVAGSDSGWAVGGRVFAGVDISKHVFLEAQYDQTGKTHGIAASGFSLLLGTQF